MRISSILIIAGLALIAAGPLGFSPLNIYCLSVSCPMPPSAKYTNLEVSTYNAQVTSDPVVNAYVDVEPLGLKGNTSLDGTITWLNLQPQASTQTITVKAPGYQMTIVQVNIVPNQTAIAMVWMTPITVVTANCLPGQFWNSTIQRCQAQPQQINSQCLAGQTYNATTGKCVFTGPSGSKSSSNTAATMVAGAIFIFFGLLIRMREKKR